MDPPLPPPGPAHYHARRARWLAHPGARPDTRPHPSHVRLQRALTSTDPRTDPLWDRGVDQVWRGLVKGNQLKHPLPMSLLIKIIHAAWRRDPLTWPEGAVAPDSDDPPTAISTGACPGHAPDNPPQEPS